MDSTLLTAAMASTRSTVRVMVVEDVALLRMAAVELVKATCGTAPTVAANGREALEHARHADFDVILMDIQMPVMDGVEAVRQLRIVEAAGPGHRRTPIVAYTTEPGSWGPVALAAAGFDGLLAKPATRDAMAGCLRLFGIGLPGRALRRPAHDRIVVSPAVVAATPRVAEASSAPVRASAAMASLGASIVSRARRRIERADDEALARAEACMARSLAVLRQFESARVGSGSVLR